ncbi:carbohydrate kinase [Phormidium tenue FACHB-886]|nr:carbohydrate kinase [Phormidium tenue FACHB-886]
MKQETPPQVLCLGEILWDYLADHPAASVSEVTSWTRYPGGAPANVACALVKLGTPAGFIGCVGEDEAGQVLVELLQSLGINTKGIQRHASHPTRLVEVLRDAAGDRQFAGFAGGDTTQFADAYLQAELIPEHLFSTAKFLTMGTLEAAYEETGKAITHSLALANQHSLQVVMDVNWRSMFWTTPDTAKSTILDLVQRINFLKLSIEEAEWLYDATDAGAIAQQNTHLSGVLVTAGEHGCTYCFGENQGSVPAFKIEVEDTTGAGDGFVAGFIHQLCQRGTAALRDSEAARSIVRYASAVGALTTTRPGAIDAQPTAPEVEAFLYLQGA